MILRKLILKNFQGFYGDHLFDFSNGLTLINARNGDGKTSLARAISLLFNDNRSYSRCYSFLSAKIMSELHNGDDVIVSMKLYFEHNGEKAIERRIKIIKKEKGYFFVQTDELLGFSIYGNQEIQVPYQSLLDTFTLNYIGHAVINDDYVGSLDKIINYFGRQYAEFRRDIQNIESLVNMNLNTFEFKFYTHLNVKLKIVDNDIKVVMYNDKKDNSIITNPNYVLTCIVGYSLLFSIKSWHEEITGKDYPIILDSPMFSIFDPDIFRKLFNIIENNHQVIMLTGAFFDYKKELDIDKLEQINCCAYYIRKEETFDPCDLASISFLEKKLF